MSQSLLEQSEIPGMETLGEVFSKARKEKKISASRAAEATRMKMQHIEAMERNDFSVFAAAAYAKGFIKIYAEYLGLDPAPLIANYTEHYAPKERAPLVPEHESDPRRKRSSDGPNLLQRIPWASLKLPPAARSLAWKAALAAVVVAAISWTASALRNTEPEPPATAYVPLREIDTSALIADPPAPYLDWEYVPE